MPKVSIVCPVYNAESYVEDCVNSCLSQTLADIELIFVDDGSRDGSLQVLHRLMEGDPRLKVLSQKNAGAAAARNNGLSHASGEFVFFIDADDYIPSETALERLYEAATTRGVEIAGGSMCIDRSGKVDFDSLHGAALDSFSKEEVREYSDYQYDYDFTRYIYSRSLIERSGARFPERSQFEDPVFFVKIMLAAGRFATIPDAVYAYRYGYQKRTWSSKAILDRLEGIQELLKLSHDRGLAKLHRYVLNQLDTELSAILSRKSDDDAVMSALYRSNSLIDCALLQAEDPEFPDAYIIEPLRWINTFYTRFMPLHRLVANRYTLALKRRLFHR